MCNEDCVNCKYEKCQNVQGNERAMAQHRYYEKNKERLKAYYRSYWAKHKDELNARRRKTV